MKYKLMMHYTIDETDRIPSWDVDYLEEGVYETFDDAYERALEYIRGEKKFDCSGYDQMFIEHGQESFGFYLTADGWEDDLGKNWKPF
jgi:hypothetical protein